MHLSIRGKMLTFIAVPTAVIYITALVLALQFSYRQSRRDAERDMSAMAQICAARFDDFFRKAALIADGTARFVEMMPDLEERQIYQLLHANLATDARLYGSCMAFEPGTFLKDDSLFGPYVYRGSSGLQEMNIDEDVYDYREWQWFQEPKQREQSLWTDPYFDEGAGNVLMATYTTPFFRDGKFTGVNTIDINLPHLREEVGKDIVGENEFLILTSKGQFVYSPRKEEIMAATIIDVLTETNREDLSTFAETILSGATGSASVNGLVGDGPHLVSYAPIPSTGWAFVTFTPEADALAEYRRRRVFLAGAFGGALLLTLLSIFVVSGRLTRPISALREKVLQIAGGDLEVRAEGIDSQDEIGELARSFNQMTADLNENVRRAAREVAQREQAEDANRAKSDFLSHMSHELRTPLNGVLGYAQILMRDPKLTSIQRESLDAIVSCGEHLLSLINDVLDLSKIEAGKLEIDMRPCDLHKLIRDVADVVGQRASSKGLECRTEVALEVPRAVRTDPGKLRQVLINLLGNAVKFTGRGSVALNVRQADDGMIRMDVEDTGMGINEEDLGAIFESFKQVEGGKAVGGTGLGLAISRKIVEQMGGRMEVTSEYGEGSCFSVILPLEEADIESIDELQEEAPLFDSRQRVLAPNEDVTILVADDRHNNRDILKKLLEMSGFKTVFACDGVEALEVLRATRVPLVLMDVRMPRMTGIEAVREIRNDPELRETIVIAVTASVLPEFKDHAKEAGFNDLLSKPLKAGELFDVLERYLGVSFVDEDGGSSAEPAAEAATSAYAEIRDEDWESLIKALKIRNVTVLNRIADEFTRSPDTREAGNRIGALVRGFDFEALEKLVASAGRAAAGK